MRKMLADGMRMKKNPQTKEDTFWFFTDFHGVMRVVEFHQLASLTPKSSATFSNTWY